MPSHAEPLIDCHATLATSLAPPSISKICHIMRRPKVLAVLFVLQVSGIVLALGCSVPPFENPDEFDHMDRVDQVASGRLIGTRFGGAQMSGGKVDLGINRIDQVIGVIRDHPGMKVSRAMLQAAGQIPWGQRGYVSFANTAIYPPFLYMPAALGDRIGKITNLSVVHTLVLCRILTAISSIALAASAIALAGDSAILLFVILSLPMCISLFAAVSQDGPMLGLAALGCGYAAYLARRNSPPAPRSVLVLASIMALAAMGRPPYACLSVILFWLPNISFRIRMAGVAVAILPVAAWSALAGEFVLINAGGPWGVHPGQQMHFLLSHPFHVFGLIRHAFTDAQGVEGESFVHEFIGVLGWTDVILPAAYYKIAESAMAIAILVTLFRSRAMALPAGSRALMAAGGVGAIVLIFLLQYLTWTPVGAAAVHGVQGRYFLPIAMFLPAMLPALSSSPLAKLVLAFEPMLLGFPSLSAVVTLHAIVTRYYL
jgi:hypothetical protein